MNNKFFRRVAVFILLDKNNKIILQHRASDAKRLPNYWGFFGGGIEEGETPEEALIREAQEELGIQLSAPKIFRRYEFEYDGNLQELNMFIEQLQYPVEQLEKQQTEGDKLGLFTFEEALNLKMIEIDKKALQDLKDEIE